MISTFTIGSSTSPLLWSGQHERHDTVDGSRHVGIRPASQCRHPRVGVAEDSLCVVTGTGQPLLVTALRRGVAAYPGLADDLFGTPAGLVDGVGGASLRFLDRHRHGPLHTADLIEGIGGQRVLLDRAA
jgi:hypothetical protein